MEVIQTRDGATERVIQLGRFVENRIAEYLQSVSPSISIEILGEKYFSLREIVYRGETIDDGSMGV